MRALVLSLFVAVSLCSCATRAKTYVAPSAAKVDASAKRLAAAVGKASERAVAARAKVADAQADNDKLSAASVTILTAADDLARNVPPEFQPQVAEIRNALSAQQTLEAKQGESLRAAWSENDKLVQDLQEARAAESEHKANLQEYKRESALLAVAATNERTKLISVERQLSSQKWAALLWKIGGGIVVAGIIGLVVLWFTGKLGVVAAKIALKVAL